MKNNVWPPLLSPAMVASALVGGGGGAECSGQ